MKYKGYTGVVELEEESVLLFGLIGLRDVITFQGSSVAEILAFQVICRRTTTWSFSR